MTLSVLIAVGSFLVCFQAANRSLKRGLCAVLTIGYLYGITRANRPDTWTYVMFDLGVIGLYAAQLIRSSSREEQARTHDLRFWMVALMAWPTLLFVLFPSQNPMVELVGLRANMFLLPFLLFGARLSDDDLKGIALYMAALNIAAVALGAVEFVVGIERFFPLNEATELIYKSRDLVEHSAYRIPSSFVNAHAFAGTLAMTLPLLLGGWSQVHGRKWAGPLLSAAIVASFMGIFMAATRTHMITATLLAFIVTLTGGLSQRQWLKWLVGLGIVAYLVAGDARFQRFTTLGEKGVVSERIAGSVNQGFFDVASEHPLGNGLASGGTSVPYFLRGETSTGMLLESEYARIAIEQGLPGLTLWVFFIFWVMTRRPARVSDSWVLGRRLALVACLSVFASGMLGIGMMASVPQTSIMLLVIGWMTTPRGSVAVDEEPEAVELMPQPVRQ